MGQQLIAAETVQNQSDMFENITTPNLTGFLATLESVNLADLIQLACLEGNKRVLDVKTLNGMGKIYFAKGEIVHAETENLSGQEAFFEIMTWPAGEVTFKNGDTNIQSIDMSWNFLLIEALRKKDEGGNSVAYNNKTTEVLVVDDSPLISKAIRKILKELGNKVAGEAPNGKEALKFMESHAPDLITLDINMPVMGGDVTIKHIMIRSPAPVVLVSGIDKESYPKMMDFVRLGAIDVIPKPQAGEDWNCVHERLKLLVEKLPDLKIKNIRRARSPVPARKKNNPFFFATKLLIIIGGIGGVLELQKIMPSMELDAKTSILLFQDMDFEISRYFPTYMDQFTSYNTTTIEADQKILGGQCIVSPWKGSWEIHSNDENGFYLKCVDENGKFEIDNLLLTASEQFKESLRAIVLSGSDIDMEIGLESISSKGGAVILQTPETSLHPAPLIKMKAMELEDKCLDIEKITYDLANFLTVK